MDTPSPAEFGETEITDLVAAFYRRVRTDDLIGPMYPEDDWEGSEKRLRDFLIFRFGGSCLLYTSPSPRDATLSRMPSSA